MISDKMSEANSRVSSIVNKINKNKLEASQLSWWRWYRKQKMIGERIALYIAYEEAVDHQEETFRREFNEKL